MGCARVLTEHLRTVGGADCTQIAALRPIGASHNSTLTFSLLRCGRARRVIPASAGACSGTVSARLSAAYLTRLHRCAALPLDLAHNVSN
jgi:hypothetical protein